MASAVIFAYPNSKEHPTLMAAVFFVGAFVSMVPWLFFDAPYSFWVVACVLWFCSPFIFAVCNVVFHAVLSTLGAP
jgi:VIT1/CCC1 family predicted Fe2+/Mn2+ transporter